MENKKHVFTRLISLLLAAVMVTGLATACGKQDRDGKPAESTSSAAVDQASLEQDVSALLVDADVPYINVPDENAQIAQELKLSVDGTAISGAPTADDVVLKDAFEGMQVTGISGDENAVTLTVSGTPTFDPEKANTGNYGTVEIAGKYFGEEKPVAKKIPVVCLGEDAAVEGGYFYPFFDSAVEKDGAYELTITLCARSADFVKGFGEDRIMLDNDFENAKITSLKKKDDKADDAYTMVLTVPAKTDDANSWGYFGGITLKENSLVDRNGKPNAEPVSDSRSYSTESLGRDMTPNDIDTMKEIVGGFGNTTWGTIFGTISGAGSVASFGYTALGWFGVFPTNASRHAEVMKELAEIKDKVNILNSKVDEMNYVIQQQTDILYEIEKDQKETALDTFGKYMTKMTSAIADVEYALSEKNIKKIETILDNYADVELDDPDEMSSALNAVAVKIGKLRANNTAYISDKITVIEENFRDVVSSLNQTGSNPINRYVELCSIVDNFSTTSLVEKQAYALNIEMNLKKAMGLLNFFNGFDANKANRELFENVYFPDVTAGVTKNGMPFCYLMNGYVKLTQSDYFWTDIGANQDFDHAKYKFMSREDGRRFADRMHGRTLWQELIRAGYPESMLKQRTEVGSRTGGYEPDQIAEGIGFVWVSTPKMQKLYYEMKDYCVFPYVQVDETYVISYRPDHIRNTPSMHGYVMFGSSSRIGSAVTHAGGLALPKSRTCEIRVIGAYGLMYKQKSYTDFPVAQAIIHNVDEGSKKQTDKRRYEVCYPFMHFQGV